MVMTKLAAEMIAELRVTREAITIFMNEWSRLSNEGGEEHELIDAVEVLRRSTLPSPTELETAMTQPDEATLCLMCGLQLLLSDIERNYMSHSGIVTCVNLLIAERDAAVAKVGEVTEHAKMRANQLGIEYTRAEALQQQVTDLREALTEISNTTTQYDVHELAEDALAATAPETTAEERR